MERRTPFAEYVAHHLHQEAFTLVDVGCRDGIDPGWRIWGNKLRAYAFDPNIQECKRLNSLERHPNVRYIPGFVGIPASHPFARKKAGHPHNSRNPWDRLSTPRSVEIVAGNGMGRSQRELTDLNLWQMTDLADADKPIYLADFFRDNQINDVDFVKIDVDGADYEILASLEACFDSHHILGVGLEVNYVGSDEETDHTFHNTDRFLRSHGYDLFGLTVRRYSNRNLPSRYRGTVPGATEFGRPLQGDALYLRDLGSPDANAIATRLSDDKLAKLAATFSLCQLPDCAAELLVQFRDRFASLIDVDDALDLLAQQAQVDQTHRLSYRAYMAAFEANSPMFYIGKFWPLSESPRLLRRGLRLVRDRLFRSG